MTKTITLVSTAFLLTASTALAGEARSTSSLSGPALIGGAGEIILIGSGDRGGFWSNLGGLRDDRHRERQARYDDDYDDDDDDYDDDDYDDRDDGGWDDDRDEYDRDDDDDDYDDDDDDYDDYDDD
ncbi:MAG: hypothetical protein AAF366_02435 [Pseudomonadota bacterium]